jgi:hypothetical protein
VGEVVNVYLIQEDGEANCYQAKTAVDAIEVAFVRFLNELSDDELANFHQEYGESPRQWWNRNCFQSCTLIGELVNP